MFEESLSKIISGKDLSPAEVTEFVENMRDEVINDVQIGGFLVGLLMKGPTVDEVVAITRTMRDNCVQIKPKVAGDLVDTCGTGGGPTTFNVSTANAILTAAAGVPVAKHGSRSISASSGSADALEALGIKAELTPEQGIRLIEEIGISFLYAPSFHPLMLKVFVPEQALGIKTIFFTIIGPLINPAGAERQLIGVYQPHLVDFMADVVAQLPHKHVIIAHGVDGVDEFSIMGPSSYAEIKDGKITRQEVTPEDFGFKRAKFEDVKGGDPKHNAQVIRDIFEGRDQGPRRDFIVLNNGFMLYIAGLAASPQEGMGMAQANIDSGAASKKLAEFAERSQNIGV